MCYNNILSIGACDATSISARPEKLSCYDLCFEKVSSSSNPLHPDFWDVGGLFSEFIFVSGVKMYLVAISNTLHQLTV